MNNTSKTFTTEQIQLLRSNPYTLYVSEQQIRFSLTFKQAFIVKRNAGQKLHSIFEDLGYPMDIIGKYRARNIDARIKKEAASPEGLHENNKMRKIHPDQTAYNNMNPNHAMIQMQHEILYLRQEMDFLKKIIELDNSKGSDL